MMSGEGWKHILITGLNEHMDASNYPEGVKNDDSIAFKLVVYGVSFILTVEKQLGEYEFEMKMDVRGAVTISFYRDESDFGINNIVKELRAYAKEHCTKWEDWQFQLADEFMDMGFSWSWTYQFVCNPGYIKVLLSKGGVNLFFEMVYRRTVNDLTNYYRLLDTSGQCIEESSYYFRVQIPKSSSVVQAVSKFFHTQSKADGGPSSVAGQAGPVPVITSSGESWKHALITGLSAHMNVRNRPEGLRNANMITLEIIVYGITFILKVTQKSNMYEFDIAEDVEDSVSTLFDIRDLTIKDIVEKIRTHVRGHGPALTDWQIQLADAFIDSGFSWSWKTWFRHDETHIRVLLSRGDINHYFDMNFDRAKADGNYYELFDTSLKRIPSSYRAFERLMPDPSWIAENISSFYNSTTVKGVEDWKRELISVLGKRVDASVDGVSVHSGYKIKFNISVYGVSIILDVEKGETGYKFGLKRLDGGVTHFYDSPTIPLMIAKIRTHARQYCFSLVKWQMDLADAFIDAEFQWDQTREFSAVPARLGVFISRGGISCFFRMFYADTNSVSLDDSIDSKYYYELLDTNGRVIEGSKTDIPGRMPTPGSIVDHVSRLFDSLLSLKSAKMIKTRLCDVIADLLAWAHENEKAAGADDLLDLMNDIRDVVRKGWSGGDIRDVLRKGRGGKD